MKLSVFLDSLGRDLRFTLRTLPRRPAFTLAAVLTLALGIGATTAIFSVVYSVLIRPLPYPNADELVRIRYSAPGIKMCIATTMQRFRFTGKVEGFGTWPFAASRGCASRRFR